MTTTTIINAQSIGTGANVGEGLFAGKTTLQAATTSFILSARITNGASNYQKTQSVEIYYSTSPFNSTAANGPVNLAQTAHILSVRPSQLSSGVAIKDSVLEMSTAGGATGAIYYWCSVPNVLVAQTLDLVLVEMP
jgi:hypothetical protein